MGFSLLTGNDAPEAIIGILGFVCVAAISVVFLGLWLWSVFWAFRDAEQRGKPGCLVALLVAVLSWPLGLLAWVLFRPEERDRP